MNQPLYTVEILRLAASIPHLGKMAEPQGSAELRSPTCGSWVSVQVRLDGKGRVSELAQQVEACAFGQASASLMGSHAIGRSAGEVEDALAAFEAWLSGGGDERGGWPGLDALSPAQSRRGRHGAMLLPFRALLAAILEASQARARSARAISGP